MTDIVKFLRAGQNDPMWADHCEMPKVIAKAAADEIERLRAQIRRSASQNNHDRMVRRWTKWE